MAEEEELWQEVRRLCPRWYLVMWHLTQQEIDDPNVLAFGWVTDVEMLPGAQETLLEFHHRGGDGGMQGHCDILEGKYGACRCCPTDLWLERLGEGNLKKALKRARVSSSRRGTSQP